MKISVVMACFNNEKVVSRAIESILYQTFSDFEFIIINDGSTDGTLDIIKDYGKNDKRIVIIDNQKNIFLSGSLNKGIRAARTKYIARMDGDDFSLPHRLETQYAFLQNNSHVDIVGSAMHRISQKGKQLSDAYLPERHDDIIAQIYKKNPLYHPTLMIRKRVFDTISYYDPKISWAEDSDLWYRIYDQVIFHNLQEPLLIYTTKDRLSLENAKAIFAIKFNDIRRRNLLLQQTPQLFKDILILSKSLISTNL